MRLVWCPQVLAVNVSGVQLKNASELKRGIEASLVRWNVDPGDIELELTESVLVEATQRHSLTLENSRRLGTTIAIDDFGTGCSSLKYLTTYPVNRLKLAQEFVFRVTVDYRYAAVVRAAIRLAHELNLDVIAEGVETEAQMRLLDRRGLRACGRLLFQPAGQGGRGDGDAARWTRRAGGPPRAPVYIGGVTPPITSARIAQASPLRKASRRRRSRLVGRFPGRCAFSAVSDPGASLGVRSSYNVCATLAGPRRSVTSMTRTTASLPE